MILPRRSFLAGLSGGFLAAAFGRPSVLKAQEADGAEDAPVYPEFPAHDPKLVEAVVRLAHFDLDGVRELIKDRPALAKASWDWGFGDWESALGAASHMGRRDMAELLIAHGARPNLFTFAMFDQVDAVRAIIEANPDVQRIPGPHGITLLAHARNGKADRVIEYLSGVPGADDGQADRPLDAEMKQVYLGVYALGRGEDDVLEVVTMNNGQLGIKRGQRVPRHLFHLGDHTFHPTGAPKVRINFRVADGPAESVTVHDADLVVTARRIS